jgi:hypothetical protein
MESATVRVARGRPATSKSLGDVSMAKMLGTEASSIEMVSSGKVAMMKPANDEVAAVKRSGIIRPEIAVIRTHIRPAYVTTGTTG